MNPIITFSIVFSALLCIVLFFTFKWNLLNDDSILLTKKPYSFARTQLAWWTVIILSSFISIILVNKYHGIPEFRDSTIQLLTISASVLAAAKLTDVSDQKQADQAGKENASPANPDTDKQKQLEEDAKKKAVNALSRNQESQSFLIDILSDQSGVSIHRLQTLIFNIVFGCWFIYSVLKNLKPDGNVSTIMPEIETRNLVLLGVSAGTYIALKTGENKTKQV